MRRQIITDLHRQSHSLEMEINKIGRNVRQLEEQIAQKVQNSL